MTAAPATQPFHEPLSQRLWSGTFWFILLLALFSYGANNTGALPFVTLFIFLMLPLALWRRGIAAVVVWPFTLATILLCTIAIWATLQAIPLPGGLFANPIWTEIGDLVPSAQPRISVTPGDVPFGLLKVALPFGMFLISLCIFDTDARAMSALKFIAIAGGVIAFFSIAQFYFFPESLVFGKKQFYLDSLTAPFVNRNTAGTFFGLTALVLVATTVHSASKIDWGRLLASLEARRPVRQKKTLATTAILISLCLISITALFLTKSRGATGATFAAFVVFALIMTSAEFKRSPVSGFEQKTLFQRSWRIFLWLGLIATMTLAYSALAGKVMLRAEVQGLDDGRFCVMPGIWTAIRDYWPLGAGLTSFREIFPAYRDAACGINNVWDRAHNGYAEGLLSIGILFPVILLTLVLGLLIINARGLKTRRRLRFVAALGFATMTLVFLHAAVDFSLQIPGLAAFYATLTGPIVTICMQRSRAKERRV